jgi:hypothetical protein
MTGPEHYTAAEQALEAHRTLLDEENHERAEYALREAEVHAALANAGATYTAALMTLTTTGGELRNSVDIRAWDKVAGVPVQ